MPRRLIELRCWPDAWVLTPSFSERIVHLSYPFNDGIQAILVGQSRAYYPVAVGNIRSFSLKPETDVFRLAVNLFPEEALAFKAIPLDFKRKTAYCRVLIEVDVDPTPDSQIVQLQSQLTEQAGAIAAQESLNLAQANAIATLQQQLATLAAPLEWHPLPLSNGWQNFGEPLGAASYGKSNGFCRLRGVVKGGAAITIAFLPEGFRPSGRRLFDCLTGDAAFTATQGRIDILASGEIQVYTSAWGFISLDGISFEVAT